MLSDINTGIWDYLLLQEVTIAVEDLPGVLNSAFHDHIEGFLVGKQPRVSSLFKLAPTPQNDQTHSNNSSLTADKLFDCV